MNKRTPAAQASISAAEDIANLRLADIEKAGGTYKRIAEHLCAIAFSDIADYVTIEEGGAIQAKPINSKSKKDNIAKKKRFAIKKVKEHTTIKETKEGEELWKDSRIEFELHDKMDALKYLVKLRGDEPADRHELIGGNGPIEVTATVRVIPSGTGSAKD